jgi:hypothetical protein
LAGDNNEQYSNLAKLCGYIGDKRFIVPLIESLDKPDNFRKVVVIEALVRMHVEPYYSDYVKFRIGRSLEQIKNEELNFEIEELADVIRTQEAFLEISKYLLSDVPCTWLMVDDYVNGPQRIPRPVHREAFYLIRDNLENEDLKEMFKNKGPNPELNMRIYEWMQKNYGKYKIRWIW